MELTTAKVVGPRDGKAGFLGSVGGPLHDRRRGRRRPVLTGRASDVPARAGRPPLHRHTREDEYSYVTEGRVGALLGDDVVVGGPGDLIFKPRNQWHTFWNAATSRRGSWRSSRPPASSVFFVELVDLGAVAGG